MNPKQSNQGSKSPSRNNNYYAALIKQKESEIQGLNSQIDSLKIENTSILNSFSFKLGKAISAPLRLIKNLFKPSKKKTHNPIKTTCDTAIFNSGYLEISGWAVSDTLITKVAVFINGVWVTNARLGLFRKDVLEAIPENPESEFSGFVIHFKHPSMPPLVKLEVHDSKGYVVFLEKVVIPATNNMQYNDQYLIMLQQQEQKKQQKINKLLNEKFKYQPLITFILQADNTPIERLNACINSIIKQHYVHWQLCVVYNKTEDQTLDDFFINWQKNDQRIKTIRDQSHASFINPIIDNSEGDYMAFLPAADELSHDALLQVVNVLNQNYAIDIIYADSDNINTDGTHYNPHFKPDFNLDALLSWNYIGDFAIINKKAGKSVGWFDHNNTINIYDLYLKLASNDVHIHHIAEVLHHRYLLQKNTTNNRESDKVALQNYITSNKLNAELSNGLFGNSFRIKRKILQQDHVSIIVPFKDQVELLKTCIHSLLTFTDYANFSVLLINNQSQDKHTLDYCTQLTLQHENISLHNFDAPFNFAKINNWAIEKTTSEYVLLLNNDTEVINPDWLSAMVEHIQRPKVGAVGAKLLFPDNTIQHAGVVVSSEGAVHNNRFLADGACGYFNRSNYIQNVSACTAACLLLKKSVFLQVGGFDQERFAVAYNDVDLCLKIRQAGYLITYTPYAKLYHYESQSRGQDTSPEKLSRFTQELQNYQNKWAETYKNGDPYLNPNLAPASEKMTLNLD